MMFSTRPYLLRAFYEWIVDNEWTPYIVVNALFPDVQVPEEYIESGQIVFNIDMRAVKYLDINNEAVTFEARFSGKVHQVYVPIEAIMAVYAKENGRGMVFTEEELEGAPPGEIGDFTEGKQGKQGKGKGKRPPHLTIVK
jgi:stringent starvation protein B